MKIIERIDPVAHKKDLMYPEHLGRYAFASQFVKNKVVLDAACGNGYGSHYLATRGGAARVYGVDLAAEAIDYSRRYFEAENIEFIQGDATKMTFIPDHSVDVVVSFETIEHVPDYIVFLNELERVLKPGGVLVISCPNDFIFNPDNPYHLHKFTLDQFQSQMEKRFKEVQYFAQNNTLGTSIAPAQKNVVKKDICAVTAGLVLEVERKEFHQADTWVAVCSHAPLSEPLPVAAFLNEYSQYVKEITEANQNLYDENQRLSADKQKAYAQNEAVYRENKKLSDDNQRLSAAWEEHVNTINVHIEYIKRIEDENRALKEALAACQVATEESGNKSGVGTFKKLLDGLKHPGKSEK